MRNNIVRLSLLVALGCVFGVMGQSPFGSQRPDRGAMPYGAIAVSELESVDLTTGGIGLRIPLAKLPPGRGGMSHSLDLTYSSQIYNLTSQFGAPWNVLCGNPCPSYVNALEPAVNTGGGWQYAFAYRFQAEQRAANVSNCGSAPDVETATNGWRYSIIFPDGSSHLLRLDASAPGTPDGYYPFNPAGVVECNLNWQNVTLPMRFHTTDGTFVQVLRGTDGWRAIFADGRQVSTPSTSCLAVASRICDRNNNCVAIENKADSDGVALTELVDDFGRRIRVRYTTVSFAACPQPTDCTSTDDLVFQAGFGQAPTDPAGFNNSAWTVTWTNTQVGGSGSNQLQYICTNPATQASETCVLTTSFRNVSSIALPTDTATPSRMRYQFCYADAAAPSATRGFGELTVVSTPNGSNAALDCAAPAQTPRVEYRWQGSLSQTPNAQFSSENALISKTLYRQENLAGTSSIRADAWTYAFPGLVGATGTVLGPDGGTTTHSFLTTGLAETRRLLWKTVSPLGASVEKFWAINEPWIGVTSSDRKNAYVRAEFRRPGVSSPYTATAYQYDKNGNLLRSQEFAVGVTAPASPPTALPTGTVLREVRHEYHAVTPSAETALLPGSRCGGVFANAYWGCNPNLIYKTARFRSDTYQRTALLTDSLTAVAATQYVFDNALTTANPVNVARWDDTRSGSLPAPGSPSANPPALNATNAEVTSFSWSQGNMTSETGADGDVTSYSLGDMGCPSMVSATNLSPRSITRHFGQPFAVRADYSYDCASGLPKTIKQFADSSTKPLRETYDYDRFGRLTGTTVSTGSDSSPTVLNQAAQSYDDLGFTMTQRASMIAATDQRAAVVTYVNPGGFVERVRSNDDASGTVTAGSTNGVVVESAYQYRAAEAARYELESAPFKPVPEAGVAQPPQAWIRRRYDRDGRLVALHTLKRNTALPFPWAGVGDLPADILSSQSWGYSGYDVAVTDAAGRTRTESRDGLGRLTAVAQAGVATTAYSYPPKQFVVKQTDSSNYGSPVEQIRTFSYTSLERLASAQNPESGTTAYTYRLGGLPLTRTDARSQSVTFGYDGAQRMLSKTYSATVPSTPNVTYCYAGKIFDGSGCADLGGRSGDGLDFPMDRLTGYGSASGTTNMQRIDALGRATKVEQRVAGSANRMFEYSYGSGGGMLSMTYPSGRVVSYTLSDAGRATQVLGAFNGSSTYVSSLKYSAGGAPLRWSAAGGALSEVRTYNELGQATQVEVMRGTSLVHRLGYSYGSGNNGNVLGHSIETGQRVWNQFFGYDGANRLRMAVESTVATAPLSDSATCGGIGGAWADGEWCERFGFDGFGNIWSAEHLLSGVPQMAANGPSWYRPGGFGAVTNRYGGGSVGHDAAGNQTQLQVNDATVVTDYDAEGRLVRRRDGGGAVLFEYLYDGEGRRVRKAQGTSMSWYFYGAEGELAAEYSNQGAGSAGPEYLLTDALGSVRTKANGAGLALARFDYEPFGRELPRNSSGGDRQLLRFTGKERDPETGLDYMGFRYYGGAQGRFTSPDEPLIFADSANPQSWNLYSYGLNNPMLYSDPDGHEPCVNGVNPESGNICAVATAEKPKVATNSSPIGHSIIPMLVTTVQVVQKTQELFQPAADWLSQPRNPICTAGYAGLGASIGFWAGGGFGGLVMCSTGGGSGGGGGVSGQTSSNGFWRDLKPFRGKTKTNGLQGNNKRFFERDHTHGDVEVYDGRGRHLGSADPNTGAMTKPAVSGRSIRI